MTNHVKVIVPGTTANIGVGFDCLGAALTIYNEFTFTRLEGSSQVEISVEGKEAAKVSTDSSNLLYRSFLKLYQHLDQAPPSVAIHTKLGAPLSRGLGSSATAIVGGLVGANQLAGKPLSTDEIVELAIAIEGHPDNVVPALLGNCQITVGEPGNWQIAELRWNSNLIPIVAIPNFELSTEEARAVLPDAYSHGDAIFNISRMGLLLRGLAANNQNWLTTALEDKLHQPYRQKLIPGYKAVKQAAIAAGAYGMVISGAGPTLLALANSSEAEQVANSMNQAWQAEGISAEVKCLSLEESGTAVIVS